MKESLTGVLIVLVSTATSWKQDLQFGDCWSVYNVNDDQTYELKWTGDRLFTPCQVSFHGFDSENPLNEYKVCFRASTWNIADSEVELKYYAGSDVLTKNLVMLYTKGSYDIPYSQWCSFGDQYVNVELKTSDASYNQGNITLQVSAVMTYKYYQMVGLSVGGAMGGVLLVSLFFVVVAVLARRRRMASRAVYRQPTVVDNTISSQSGSQQMTGGIENPGYGNVPTPPPYYQTNNNSYPPPPYQQHAGVHKNNNDNNENLR